MTLIDRTIQFVEPEHPFMTEARKAAWDQPIFAESVRVGCVLVQNNVIIARANNYNPYHAQFGCLRRRMKTPSGQDYHLCPGCDPATHAEPRAIRHAIDDGFDVRGAAIYMYGHYLACESCWQVMLDHGIGEYFNVTGAEKYAGSDPVSGTVIY